MLIGIDILLALKYIFMKLLLFKVMLKYNIHNFVHEQTNCESESK